MSWITRSTLLAAIIALAPIAHADVCNNTAMGQLSHDDLEYCKATYKARAAAEALKNGPHVGRL